MKGYFEITMKYIEGMQFFESDKDLYENIPNLFFFEEFFFLFVFDNFLIEVTVIGKFHDDAM